MTRSKNILALNELPTTSLEFVLCDIDDTLTTHGQLRGEAYQALWNLSNANFKVIPVTGRPAGWCEMIARFWPVHGVIGENGGFYFYFDKKMQRYYLQDELTRTQNQKKLSVIQNEVLKDVPGSALASDQFCRVIDLAIDFCEDVPALPKADIQKIVSIFEKHGATAKISSIHVNGWYGDHDKLSTFLVYAKERLGLSDSHDLQNKTVFIGDSPNDEPMFKYFKNSVGVQNITPFLDDLKSLPQYICSQEGGAGFVEFAKHLLKK